MASLSFTDGSLRQQSEGQSVIDVGEVRAVDTFPMPSHPHPGVVGFSRGTQRKTLATNQRLDPRPRIVMKGPLGQLASGRYASSHPISSLVEFLLMRRRLLEMLSQPLG